MREAGDRRWLYTAEVLVLLPYLASVQGVPVNIEDPQDLDYLMNLNQRSPDSFDDVDNWDLAFEPASTPPPTTYVCKSDVVAGLNYTCPLSQFCCENEYKPGVVYCCTLDPSLLDPLELVVVIVKLIKLVVVLAALGLTGWGVNRVRRAQSSRGAVFTSMGGSELPAPYPAEGLSTMKTPYTLQSKPYPQEASYPGEQHLYPGQQPPPYPGQQPPYPGQQPPYPGQLPPYPGQQSPYPGESDLAHKRTQTRFPAKNPE